ncbi:Di-copper centre-containing protein [Aaosphaeria arxii CBS 175.79]|uniref:tyrosinase n=1 Tax=Aaosphaeria arxii CBS 175.79 TaxID=1450172 RepID=A0A6A5XGX1_9PLEO|nr:Di-copper centre-containing protein [Aaosphaeria arxii CBS 175.79]KAF2011614.1 Di-copper centre-containing protein [Aaosphaeria arxii CBS 175.79]
MVAYSKPQGFLPVLFALIVFVQATLALHGAHHHAHRSHGAHLEETEDVLNKRANNIAIRGVQSPLAPRLEIRDLQSNSDQWNLYLLGMERFMAKPKNDRESYYQIAGVHGRPFISWNNFGPILNNAGFCPHAQTLFGSWHRPYLALFEQSLYQNVQEVINTFPSSQQGRLRAAARDLRMPYYDWARHPGNGPAVPTSIRDQFVTVTKPQGQVSIKNPLYSYSWGDSLPSEMGGGPFGNFATTLRRPVTNPTRSNNNEMNARFTSLRQSLANRVYGIFMSGASWGFVSTSAIGVRTAQNGNNPDSVEAIHDAVHTTAGGESGGHMYYLDFSAFDPFFWLHHTNVDRILAMYQKVSPDTYVANGNIQRPMAQWNAGESKNAYTPLKPFTKDTAGNYWTSMDVRETSLFNYYYPETGPGSSANSVRSTRSTTEPYPGRKFREGDYQTVLSVIANKYALDGSMVLHCFIGNSGSNSTAPGYNSTLPGHNTTAPYPIGHNSTQPSYNSTYDDFTQDPNYVGQYSVMGGSHASGSDSYPVMTEGCLPLTTALQGKEETGELKSLHPEDVEPYLAKNLHCKVYGPGNVELEPEQVPDLHLSVKSCEVTPAPSDDELPVLGEYTKLTEATKHLIGGKPFEYIPNPLDYVTPGEENGPNYPTAPGQPLYPGEGEPSPSLPPVLPSGTQPISYPTGVYPWPIAPEQEHGYCITKQTIEYIDEAGNFLYAETY